MPTAPPEGRVIGLKELLDMLPLSKNNHLETRKKWTIP